MTTENEKPERCNEVGPWTRPIQIASEGKQDGRCNLPKGHVGDHCCIFFSMVPSQLVVTRPV